MVLYGAKLSGVPPLDASMEELEELPPPPIGLLDGGGGEVTLLDDCETTLLLVTCVPVLLEINFSSKSAIVPTLAFLTEITFS